MRGLARAGVTRVPAAATAARALAGISAVAFVGCTPVTDTRAPSVPTPAATEVESGTDLPPSGYGSLRQDEFSVELQTVNLHVKVTPLDETVIRLAAPDTHDRLQALARSRAERADSLTDGLGSELFLVSFFSRHPNVAYRPEELRVTHRGRSLQPVGILPLTTGWGRQLLQPQETQSAIYVYEPPFDYDLPMTVHYRLQTSDDWHRVILPRLEEERTRVESRSGLRTRAGSRTP